MNVLRLRNGSEIRTERGPIKFFWYSRLTSSLWASYDGQDRGGYFGVERLKDLLKGYGLEYDEIVWEEVL